MKLSDREHAAILAALRLYQSTKVRPVEIANIATNEGEFDDLTDAEIDDLCERLNCEESA